MSDNIFNILGIQSREDCVSNALAYGFNQSVEFRNNFLKYICDRKSEAYTQCTAYTRVSTGVSGIPDLVLVCESAHKAELIIIENKLRADEGADQTERYATEESINALHQRLCPDVERENVTASLIFLSLFPDQTPSSSIFTTKRHSDLCAIYKNEMVIKNLADQLISDWLSLISAFYSKSSIHSDDRICEKLKDNDGLDGGYLYFRTFLSELTLPNGLEIEAFFRDSRQGRCYYGAVFSKDTWHPEETVESDGTWTLDPDKVFNIHFEPQFNVLNGILSIFLHYEVNPYETAAWVNDHIPNEQYNAYLARRSKFSELLSETGIRGWVFGGGSNQIAKVQLDFQKSSLRNAKRIIEEIFLETAKAIDHALNPL